MKSLTQVTGRKQRFFEVQKFFDEQLSGEYRAFMNMLHIIEDIGLTREPNRFLLTKVNTSQI